MAHLVTFVSTTFDVSKETPNPINPIAGESVLQWLGEKLKGSPYEAAAPGTEDWGWYIDVTGNGASYMVGASADAEDASRSIEWTIQIHKHRSTWEKITGADKLTVDDPLSRLIEGFVRADLNASAIRIERSA